MGAKFNCQPARRTQVDAQVASSTEETEVIRKEWQQLSSDMISLRSQLASAQADAQAATELRAQVCTHTFSTIVIRGKGSWRKVPGGNIAV